MKRFITFTEETTLERLQRERRQRRTAEYKLIPKGTRVLRSVTSDAYYHLACVFTKLDNEDLTFHMNEWRPYEKCPAGAYKKCPYCKQPFFYYEDTSDIMGPAGDCFRNANRWNAQKGEKTDFVCHGTVTNGEGKTFLHAWNESGDTVIDPTTGVRMAKSKYYKLLQVKDVKRYDSTTAIRNQLKFRQHGPWD